MCLSGRRLSGGCVGCRISFVDRIELVRCEVREGRQAFSAFMSFFLSFFSPTFLGLTK